MNGIHIFKHDLIIFGPPGAGKGTHADLLAKRCGLRHLSTGELLRVEVAAGTPIGQEAKSIMESGQLVPDEIVDKMVENYVRQSAESVIFDGYPRTVAQADKLSTMLEKMDRKIDVVLSIEVPREELILRLEQRSLISNRSDDNESTILRRLYEYETKSAAVVNYYRQKGLLLPIDARGSIESTQRKIRKALLKG